MLFFEIYQTSSNQYNVFYITPLFVTLINNKFKFIFKGANLIELT